MKKLVQKKEHFLLRKEFGISKSNRSYTEGMNRHTENPCWFLFIEFWPKSSILKVAFFRKCDEIFSDLQISKKKYSKKLSWAWNLNFPPITVYCNWRENLNFKLRIVFWSIFFWRFGDQKNESNFLKRSHL